ncbi:MAG: hypothetical protein GX086_03760 [Alcaligenaceae bacterium]|nr:hypothetical protein [Alcaligenaceae bacterium]
MPCASCGATRVFFQFTSGHLGPVASQRGQLCP